MKFIKKPRNTLSKKPKENKKFDYVKSQGNLVKDVKYLKKMVKRDKPEVKMITSTPTSDTVGQIDGTGGGASGFLINLSTGGGVGAYAARLGEEIKLIGINLRLQFSQQSAASSPAYFIVNVVRFDDPTADISGVINKTFSNDTISGVVDTNSTRNQLYLTDYKIVFSKRIYMPADNISSQKMVKDMKVLVKQNFILKYNGTSTAAPVNSRYALIVRASNGNKSASVAGSNTLLTQTAVSTGYVYSHFTKSYFTDA